MASIIPRVISKPSLRDIAVVQFDWDATLANSMALRTPGLKPWAFVEATLEYYPGLRRELEALRSNQNGRSENNNSPYCQVLYAGVTGGQSRFDQLAHLEEIFITCFGESAAPEGGLISKDPERRAAWSRRFNELVDDSVVQLFDDTEETVRTLRERGYTCGIGSSVPQKRLEANVRRFPTLGPHLEFVLGNRGDTFRKGPAYTAWIIGHYEHLDLRPDQILVVGDSPEDVKKARVAGNYVVAIADPENPWARSRLEKLRPDYLIHSRRELLGLLPHRK